MTHTIGPPEGQQEPGPAVVTMGEVMALFLAGQGSPLDEAAVFEAGFAGAEATVAVGLTRLGDRVRYIGALGDDALGRRIHRQLTAEGLDTTDLRLRAGAPTGVLVRDAPKMGAINVQYYRTGSAASRISRSDIPIEVVASASLLHITGITPALSDSAFKATLQAVGAARRAGVPVSFDPNVRHSLAGPEVWWHVIRTFAPLADMVLTGRDDAAAVTDGDPAAWFLDQGVGTVVVKDGARGAWETDGQNVIHQPAMSVHPLDPVGAGDAFAAGWLHAWLRGTDVTGRLRIAATVGALCVGALGDTTGLPTKDQLDDVLRSDPRFGSDVPEGVEVNR